MKIISVPLKHNSYPIWINNGLLSSLPKLLDSLNKGQMWIIFSQENVYQQISKKIHHILKSNGFKIKIIILNNGEDAKTFRSTEKIFLELVSKNCDRTSTFLAIGGGVTGDVCGFVAATFMRGVNYIQIPTTLLAQVDSSIGGKTGIKTKYGKNLIGTFYQPNLVISDTTFLKSLPKREIICGYAEILKHSLIMNKQLFNYLDKNANNILKLKKPFLEKAIYQSCLVKKKIIEKDENEKNIRQILNFGHTFAHAFEATNNYSKKLNHGEAVLLGMVCALNIANQNKKIVKTDYIKIINHYKKLNLPINIKKFFSKKKY